MQGIFLDRDGVINRERANYVTCWDEFEFLPGALTALGKLAQLNIPTFIVTNQSAIGRKIISYDDVHNIHKKMLTYVEASGLIVQDIFICPHHPDDGCGCRKPAPGMLSEASVTHNLDLAQCYFIGDSITDFQAAQSCGCRSILVRSGRQGGLLEALLADYSVAGDAGSGIESLNVEVSRIGVPIVDDLSAAVKLLNSVGSATAVAC